MTLHIANARHRFRSLYLEYFSFPSINSFPLCFTSAPLCTFSVSPLPITAHQTSIHLEDVAKAETLQSIHPPPRRSSQTKRNPFSESKCRLPDTFDASLSRKSYLFHTRHLPYEVTYFLQNRKRRRRINKVGNLLFSSLLLLAFHTYPPIQKCSKPKRSEPYSCFSPPLHIYPSPHVISSHRKHSKPGPSVSNRRNQ